MTIFAVRLTLHNVSFQPVMPFSATAITPTAASFLILTAVTAVTAALDTDPTPPPS